MESPASALLIRYGEIGIKGGNRPFFEKTLAKNLRVALGHVPELRIARLRGRMLVRGQAPSEEMARAAKRVFGVTSVSPALVLSRDPADLIPAALQATDAVMPRYARTDPVPFKVDVRRADKTYALRSLEIARSVGGALLERYPQLKVDLKEPQLTVGVDIRPEGVFLYAGRDEAPGGLPVGSTGRVTCLLSGGIDSPVAAWLAMKRGMRVDFVSFYSFPFVGPQTREKIIRLGEKLAEWQPLARLHIVPFSEYQEAIRDHAPEGYRTILYRRAMQRIATIHARRNKGLALITGESVGQVASQTLKNMRLIESASGLPVLRPLVTMDKTEIIALARRIGTYELSTLPAPDCCTVFQPSNPVIHGHLRDVEEAESKFDVDQLTFDAVRNTERIPLVHQP